MATSKHFFQLLILIGLSAGMTLTVSPVQGADAPRLEFSTYLGGTDTDIGEDIAVDREGNIYVTGATSSSDFPGSLPGNITNPKIYVLKLDPTATTILYAVALGTGTGNSIAVDTGGNAYVTGEALSLQEINPIDGAAGEYIDAFVAKVDPDGTVIYATKLGGSDYEMGMGIDVDAAGNVYVAGITWSVDFPTQSAFQPVFHGEADPISLVMPYETFVTRINAAGTALDYSTYLGGINGDIGLNIAVDQIGNAYVTGRTYSFDFPTVNAFQPNHAGACPTPASCDTDVFLTKFSPAGVPIYSTYFGGNSYDAALAITTDETGSVYLTGYTDSTNFPLLNAYQSSKPAPEQVFVSRFRPDGLGLIFSTLLGGTTQASFGTGIGVDGQGNVMVVGATAATDFPTVQPLQASLGGGVMNDAFLARFTADGRRLTFSSYWGGSAGENFDLNPRLAWNSAGSMYIFGVTSSEDFPVKNAFQATFGNPGSGNYDAFLTKISFPTVSESGAAPEPHLFVTHTPTLTWNRISGARGYHLQVARDGDFVGARVYESYPDANTLADTTDWLEDGAYSWRVQAQKADGTWGGWSAVQQFVIQSE